MDPFMTLLGVLETFGGFGPERYWRILPSGPDENESETVVIGACSEIDTCRPIEACC